MREPLRSIAVLPFKPLDEESCRAQLGVALADALITRLSRDGGIKVSPTSDILKYSCPKINLIATGQELGVDSVVDGKIQRLADKVRVTVQILRVRDGAAVWAEEL